VYAILVVETGSDVEVELCRVGTNPEPIAAAARARIIGKRTKISPLPLGTRRGSERGVVVNLFGNPTLIGLQVRLDRPVDRERPCCKNICTIGAAKGPHGFDQRAGGSRPRTQDRGIFSTTGSTFSFR
jgi:hypothetical protein